MITPVFVVQGARYRDASSEHLRLILWRPRAWLRDRNFVYSRFGRLWAAAILVMRWIGLWHEPGVAGGRKFTFRDRDGGER